MAALEKQFEWNAETEAQISKEDGIWLSGEKQTVLIKVSPAVSGYFKRRQLIPNQKIENELGDGSLVVSCQISHPNQIIPIVRYWIPHLTVISPSRIQSEVNIGLAEYLRHFDAGQESLVVKG